jgi:hypothetical protein
MNYGILLGVLATLVLVTATAYAGQWAAGHAKGWLERLHFAHFGAGPNRRRRALRRHQTAASLATLGLGTAALLLTTVPLKGGIIPFAPGTAFLDSLIRGTLIAVGTGLGLGTYLAARSFARAAARLEAGPDARTGSEPTFVTPPALAPGRRPRRSRPGAGD